MSRISLLALAAAMGATVGLASSAQAAPMPAMSADQVGGANTSVDSVQWGRRGYGPRWGYGPRYGYGYGPRWGYRRGYGGGALAAGAALGIVGGAIAAGAASPYYGYPAYGYAPRYHYYDPYGW